MTALFLKLFNMSMAANWLILAVIVLRLVLKRAPKWIHCVLWALVAIRLLCPISIESALSLIPNSEPLPPEVVQFDPHPAIHSGVTVIDNAVNPVIEETFAASPEASVNPLYVWTAVAAIVWLIGMAVLLLYAAISYFRLSRVVRESAPSQDNIYLCDRIQTPFILGLFRPRVYLPSDLSDSQMESVIAHEQAHLARRDHWWKPFGWALLTVYWFNPLCWVAYILLCRDIELACDERVIRDMDVDARKAYSLALLSCSIPRRLVSACPLAFGEVGVKERIRGVLNYKKPAFWVIAAAVLTCIAVAVCFLTNPKNEAEVPETVVFQAEILEINDAVMLVEPLSGSAESQSADRFFVPVEHMEPSPEPQVGDIIEITYNGEILETYPASLGEIFRITVASRKNQQAPAEVVELMGLTCWYTDEQLIPHFVNRTYFIQAENGSSLPIAQSFGFEIDDYIVDVDGDGITELVCNCQYGGDGHESVFVFRRNGNVIERGWLDWEHKQLDITMSADWKNWGMNSTSERYNPETRLFEVRYDTEHGQRTITTSQSTFSHFTFEEFARLPEGTLPLSVTAKNLFASMPSTFHFLSGAGGWQTELYWYGNGKFSGIFEDADAGSIARCEFMGAVDAPKWINDLEYSTHVKQLNYDKPGITTKENGIPVTTSGPYGLDDADELRIYLPGYPVSQLPAEAVEWLRGGVEEFWDGKGPRYLACFVLYNVNGRQAFFSADWSAFESKDDTHPAKAVLTVVKEGTAFPLPAIHYTDLDYSLYVPQEGWQYQRALENDMLVKRWTSEDNPDVSLTIRKLGYRDLAAAQDWERTHCSKFSLVEDKQGGLFGEYNQNLLDIQFYQGLNTMYAVELRYPMYAAEGYGAELQVVRDTFQLVYSADSQVIPTAVNEISHSELSPLELTAMTVTQPIIPSENRIWKRTVSGNTLRYDCEINPQSISTPAAFMLSPQMSNWEQSGLTRVENSFFDTLNIRDYTKDDSRLQLWCIHPAASQQSWQFKDQTAMEKISSRTVQGSLADYYQDGADQFLFWENSSGLLFCLRGSRVSESVLLNMAEAVIPCIASAGDYCLNWLPKGYALAKTTQTGSSVEEIWTDGMHPISFAYSYGSMPVPPQNGDHLEINGIDAQFWESSSGIQTLTFILPESGAYLRLQGSLDKDTFVRIAKNIAEK